MSLRFGILLTVLFLAGCGLGPRHYETYRGEKIPVGKVTPRVLARTGDWYTQNYNSYTPDPAEIARLKTLLQDVRIEIWMGAWCPDSRMHVPAFIKVLDEAGFPRRRLTVYALPRHFKERSDVRKKHIIRVPTFIVYKKDKEVGRIIEYPMETLEKDLVRILEGRYRHELQTDTP
ncbi:MAG: thioredoxin family protein [Chlorobi bacterium]|nr:thioredoxin family protein [Chlorobiota bacterium]